MPRTAETASFQFNHTMIRVRDPDISVKFYTEIIGMDLLSKKDMGDFTLYFLAFDQGQNYKDMSAEEKDKARFAREGVLELTHNHGTETDASFAGYSSGNSEPGKGFGHIAITVDDVEEACARFEKLGVQFKKRPQDGKMRHIAFILDPDGYWIEVVPSTLKL
ncbi:Glyoxalase/Bleomycin resistance protein/Dihydroxybiphenyl dioxygenase [Lentinula edodes]|uniref:lactoylglutathione lyase n=1 Tax=Lentinula lateritia TaxID=40482 RepID=A0A9W9ATN4_9AGAR|nr:Glyoxalase/Bleomycin resistance protein/Dihydroxybiphenyl dioxygenase [Lentinula edodes]KAJ3929402.1 MAG: Glyoxalase/Bleomycin resistance protein/Dihydroxybiphenyl dioxygenase [Lentinula lateritia]KAH7872755.1 Glyoxalase/Bleomycin resistance protein/Dihydroxybiphenyl dioxygenase [Lentinula edodes]KAJ3882670.1 Glyoxalase/Bleomycin resistance protein/Dihydroxybiphenyl dioxygenase [Lentinula edodes]KAJ3885836.1 Glyoxalase/Bleomycin resistance protein/Dihydroxybiphenyl dioxygenase [Lentinula edo